MQCSIWVLHLRKWKSLLKISACFEKVLKKDKEHKDAYYELGYCFDFLDMLKESVMAYDEHLKYSPMNYTAWYNRGFVLNRMG